MAMSLLKAVEDNNLDSVIILLSRGTQTEERGKFQQTALSVAAERGHAHILSVLLAYGASTDPVDIAGLTPLMRAALAGHERIVQMLLHHGAKVNVSAGRQTPLMFAVIGGDLSVARMLLESGAEVNAGLLLIWLRGIDGAVFRNFPIQTPVVIVLLNLIELIIVVGCDVHQPVQSHLERVYYNRAQ
jgi:ankyrin repeat protein